MIRLAMVGTGRWGKTLLRAFAERAEVPACVNRSDASMAEWLRTNHPSTSLTTDLVRILADDTLDAVAIATPISTHAQLAQQALDAGKHVFVEKPLAANATEAADLVALARRLGRVLFVGHTFVYDSAFAHLRRLAGGPPVFAHLRWRKYGTFTEDLLGNLVSHDVALAHALFAAPPLSAQVLFSRGIRTAADTALYRLTFGTGECIIEVDRCAPKRQKSVSVLTGEGRLLVWEEDQVFAESGDGLEPVFRRTSEPLGVEIEAFLESVRTGEPAPTDGSFGLAVVETLDRLAPAAARA